MSIRVEPDTISYKPLSTGGTTFTTSRRIFNASIGMFDREGAPRPYLADELPQLGTDSWKSLPDGRMETTYRLRDNLTWHDGTRVTAADFVLAWRLYTAPQVGIADAFPQNQMTDVIPRDERTFVVHWRRPYPGAGTLVEADFPPLPRHILEASFQQEPERITSHPFWTREYVGLGPYRLARWEPGAFIEAVAFAGHVLGRPKIERIHIMFISDPNVALANLLSGDIQLAADTSIRFQQALILQRDWVPQQQGNVVVKPDLWRGVWAQLRPQLANPRALLDVRVRRALAHGLDREALNEALFEGRGIMSEAPFIPPTVSYFAEIDRAIVKYRYDPRASEQLMADAGFRKGADGSFVSPNEGRVPFEIKTLSAAEREAEMAIMAAGWRQEGFDFNESVLPAAQATDNETRASFPSLFSFSTTPGEFNLAVMSSKGIPSADNRWVGSNRGGWANPEFDRLAEAFGNALDPSERVRDIAQMTRVFTEDVPVISVQFDQITMAHAAALRGPEAVAQEAAVAWNLHEWELR
jgi:peptide/nickel transport system substrate-binding protein